MGSTGLASSCALATQLPQCSLFMQLGIVRQLSDDLYPISVSRKKLNLLSLANDLVSQCCVAQG